jgi:hypothetical protein
MARSTPQDQSVGITRTDDTAKNVETHGNTRAGVTYDRADEALGFEDMDASDFAIPFISILQKGSPQVDPDKKDLFIEGARPGMLFNSVTHQLMDGKVGIPFIPVHRKHEMLEWIPREQGGGLAGTHSVDDPAIAALKKAHPFGKIQNAEGNDLVETYSMFGIVPADEGESFAVLSMSSTNIKEYKRWMTQARNVKVRQPDGRMVTPPLFGHVFRLKTKFNENKKGTWYSFTVEFEGGSAETARLPENSPLYLAAKGFRDLVVSGKAKAATDTLRADEGELTVEQEAAEM